MLWCGHVPHPSRYNSTSFFCIVAGAQGQLLYTFARQSFINNFRLDNVATFQLDGDSFPSSREASAISAKIILKCETSTHGPMKCTKTGKRFTKRTILIPSPSNPLTVSRFENWGDVIMSVKNTNWVREMSNHTPINLMIDIHMIPFSRLGDIPISYQNPRNPAPDSSRFDYSSDNREVFPSFRDTSARAPNIGFPQEGTIQGSPSSTIQAGFVLSQSSGQIDLIYTNNENRPLPMGLFIPLAASTSNTPTNRTSGPLRERPAVTHEIPSEEDLLAAGPSGLQARFQPRSPRPPTPSSPRRSSRLSKTAASQTDDDAQAEGSPSRNTKRLIYFEKSTSASKRRRLSPKKKSPSKSPPKTPSPPKSSPKKVGTPSPSRSLLDQSTQLLTSPERSSPGRNLGRFISMPSQDEEASVIFLHERSRQASTNNRLARRQRPLVDTTQIMNATIPVIPRSNWLPNPDPPQSRDLIPEHVALYIHVGTGVILRTYMFWEEHDPWLVYQAVIHDDVIIRNRASTNDNTDVLIDSSLLRIANESVDITFQRESPPNQAEAGPSPIQFRGQAQILPQAVPQQQMPDSSSSPLAEPQQQMPELAYPLVAVLPQQMPDFPTPPSTDATAGSSREATLGSSSETSSSSAPRSSSSSIFSIYWTSSSSGADNNDPTNAITEGIDALMGSSNTDTSSNLAESNPEAAPKEGEDGGEGGGHA